MRLYRYDLTEEQLEQLKAVLVWAELYFRIEDNHKNDEVMDVLDSVFHYRDYPDENKVADAQR